MKKLLAVIAVLAGPALAFAQVNDKALFTHIRKSFNIPADMELELKDVKPADGGFLSGILVSRYKGQSQDQKVHFSKDGRFYFLSDVFQLGKSDIAGLLRPQAKGKEDDAPHVYVTEDSKYIVLGEPRDMTVDPDKVNMSKISVTDRPMKGPANAPILLVEYSDLQCPYCKNAHEILDKELMKAFPKKVKWVFKHFPLTNIHPWAMPGAIAVACAGKQKPDAAWAIESAYFSQQKEVTVDNVKDKAMEAAKKAGLDMGKFEACYDKKESMDIVQADMDEAMSLKVNSTPTIFINGRQLHGGFREFEQVKAIIEGMLSEKKTN